MGDYKRNDPTKYKIVIYIIMSVLMIFWFFDAQMQKQDKIKEDIKASSPTP